jgi:hypothetical protein
MHTHPVCLQLGWDQGQRLHTEHPPRTDHRPLPTHLMHTTGSSEDLPQELYKLLDPSARVQMPEPSLLLSYSLNNWKLDKLIGQMGRNKATWRRSLMLYEWLKESGHQLDDRLCTTVRIEGPRGIVWWMGGCVAGWVQSVPTRCGGASSHRA